MNTTFEEVIDIYLSKIENWDYLDYTEEELTEELVPLLQSTLARCSFDLSDIKADYESEEFNRELKPIEIEILALGLVEGFISQKVNSIKVLKQHMSVKDFNLYSSANMLKQLMVAKDAAQKEMQYWLQRLSWYNKAKDIKDGE